MANKLLMNLCLDVGSAPVVLTLQPSGGGEGDYYFQVFNKLDADATTSPVGPRVTFDRSGAYRVMAWDSPPPPLDVAWFREPTWVDAQMAFSLSGGAANVGSASETDPWPPS